MTLGEKIKKYRELRELTQRELGQKVGFSAGTEDSRIRKYEKNNDGSQNRYTEEDCRSSGYRYVSIK